MSVELQWEEPQDRRFSKEEYGPIAEGLRTRPGHWARLADGLTESRTQASSLALSVRRGKLSAFKPQGAYEARSSKDKVWVRYVGENQEYASVESEVGE